MVFQENILSTKQYNYDIVSLIDSTGSIHIHDKSSISSIKSSNKFINFKSSSYLSLNKELKVKLIAEKVIKEYGIGSYDIFTPYHIELYQHLENIYGHYQIQTYQSDVRDIFFSNLIHFNDYVFYDEHLSYSFKKVLRALAIKKNHLIEFSHNDAFDLSEKLEAIDLISPIAHKFIVTEGVFELQGDLCHLQDIFNISKKFDCFTILDESNALGVIGKEGLGSYNYHQCQEKADVVFCFMNRVLCANGQFFVLNERVTTILNECQTDLFQEDLYPPVSALAAAVAKTVLDIIVDNSVKFKNIGHENTPSLHTQLLNNIKYWKKKCQSIGLKFIDSPSPIASIILEGIDTESLSHHLYNNKIKCSYVSNKRGMKYNLLKFNILRSMDTRLLDEAFSILHSVLNKSFSNVLQMNKIPKEIQIENMMDPTKNSTSVLKEYVIDSDPNVLYPKIYPKFAIIGIGMRLPGNINNKEDFWEVMIGKKVITGLIPEDRWDRDEWYSKVEKPGTIQTLHGGFIENAYDFDNKYFDISQSEALDITPEQRWLCELTVETIEDANINMDDFKGSQTGVFVGVSDMDYGSYVFSVPENITEYTFSGIESSIHANRLSYLFDLHGPSLSTNTACSSSMIALTIACNSMAVGDCEMALVAGTNFFQAPANGVAYSQLHVVSKQGACRPFDSEADGYARLEGAAMVLLKPYEQALRDNNRIYATILSAACNQDGKTFSLTTPSQDAQSQLMKRVYDKGHLDPCTIDFVEAHGTGTPIGDPIEAQSIGEAYGKVNKANGHPSLPIGSVKGNVGHGEYLSGIIGLIKGTLILHKNMIVPQTAFNTLNPKINCNDLGIRIVDKVEPLPGKGRHRVAVNSFGFGGANANVILEEEPQLDKNNISVLMKKNKKGEVIPCSYVAFFSASNLRLLKEILKKWLSVPKQELLPMLYLNATTRNILTHRIFIFTRDANEFYQTLHQFIDDNDDDYTERGYKATEQYIYIETSSDFKKGVTMTFDEPFYSIDSFIGDHTFYDTCRDLYINNSYFADCIDYCDKILQMVGDRSLIQDYDLFCAKDRNVQNEEKLKEDLLKDPSTALLINGIVQFSLVALYKYYGITPSAVIGYGTGEIAAAYAAERIYLKDAVQILYHYGQVLSMANESSPKVYSFLVGCPVGSLDHLIASKLTPSEKELISISGIPNPKQCILCGEMEILKKVMEMIEAEKVPILSGFMESYGIHSKKITEAMKDELIKRLENISSHSSSIAMFSTVKFDKKSKPYTDVLDGSYWWMNMRNPVLYAHTLSQIVNFLPSDGKNILEIGLFFDYKVFKSSSSGFYTQDRIYNCFRHKKNEKKEKINGNSSYIPNANATSNTNINTSINYNISFDQFIRFLCMMYCNNLTQKLEFNHLWETMAFVEGGDHTFKQLYSMHYDLPTHSWNHKYLRKLYKAKRNGLPGEINIVKTKDVDYLEKMDPMKSSKDLNEKINSKKGTMNKNESENLIKSNITTSIFTPKEKGNNKLMMDSEKQNILLNNIPLINNNTITSSSKFTSTSIPTSTSKSKSTSKSTTVPIKIFSPTPLQIQPTKIHSSSFTSNHSDVFDLHIRGSSVDQSSNQNQNHYKSQNQDQNTVPASIQVPTSGPVNISSLSIETTSSPSQFKKSVSGTTVMKNKKIELSLNISNSTEIIAPEDDDFWVYENNTYLVDHKVNNQIVFPAAGSVSRALYGFSRSRGQMGKKSMVSLTDLEFIGLTVFQKDKKSQLNSRGPIPMKLYESKEHQFVLKHQDGSMISKGVFPDSSPKELLDFPELSEVVKGCSTVKGGEGIRKDLIYQRANAIELQYGPEFQLIQRGRSGRSYSYVKIEVSEKHGQMICHPAVLDNCFHSVICLGLGSGNRKVLPFKIKRFDMMNGGHFKAGTITCVSQLIYQDLNRVIINLFIYDSDDQPFMKIDHMEFLVRKLKPIRPLEWQNVLQLVKIDASPEKAFPIACHQVIVICDKQQEDVVKMHLISTLASFNLLVYIVTENPNDSIQVMLQNGNITKTDTCIVDVTLLEDSSLPTAFIKIQFYVSQGLNFVMGNIRLDHAKNDENPENLFTASNSLPGMLKAARSESRENQMFTIQANTVEQFARGLFSGCLSIEEPDVIVRDNGDIQVLRLIHQKSVPPLRSKNFISEPKLVGHINRMMFRKTYGIPELNSSSEKDNKCVVVKVRMISLQNNDVLQNSYPELSDIMKGSSVVECVGTIVNVGSRVKNFKRGDFVFGISFYADYVPSTYVKIPQDLVVIVDEKDSQKQQLLISSVYAYTVALYLLNDIQADESILLSTGASDLMQALITVAQLKRIPILLDDVSQKYSRSGNPIFTNLLKNQRIISLGDHDQYLHHVNQLTNGHGVHYVIDINVKSDRENVLKECLNQKGEYIRVGHFSQNVEKSITDRVIQMNALSAKELSSVVKKAIEMINDYTVEAIELKTYPLSQMNRATIEIISGRSQGKSCLVMEEEDLEYDCLPGRLFKKDKSYLVTGAFGGVGLRVCLWMQLRGAHHLVLTTSSNPESKYHHPIVNALRQRGAEITIVKCDISKYNEVEKLFKETTPVIDGVFHFANKFGPKLIRDSNLSGFISTYEPKARGALNLHMVSQQGYPLSSFVLFSSVLDLLGNTGQIAYGGANSFLGNLVYYRRSKGLSGQCFSLPAMKGSGYLSQWKQDGQSREFSEVIEFLDAEDLPDILDFFLREDIDPCLQLMSRFQINSEYKRHIAPLTNVLQYRIYHDLTVPATIQYHFPPLKFLKELEEKEKYILKKYKITTSVMTSDSKLFDSSNQSQNQNKKQNKKQNQNHSSPHLYSPTISIEDSNSSSTGNNNDGNTNINENNISRDGGSYNSEKILGIEDKNKKHNNKKSFQNKHVYYQLIEDGIYCLTLKNDYMTLEYAKELGQAITELSQLKKMKILIIEFEENFSKGLEPSLKEELCKEKPSKSKINEIFEIYFHCMKLANISIPVICCLNGEITDLSILIGHLSNWRLITRQSVYYSRNNPINIKWMTDIAISNDDTESLKLIKQLEKENISAIYAYKLNYINDIAFNVEKMKIMALEMAKSLIQNNKRNLMNVAMEDILKINNIIKI